MSAYGVVSAITLGISDLEEEGFPTEELRAARARIAELIAADVDYDTARTEKLATYKRWNQEHDPAFASDEDFAVLRAADARLTAAAHRRGDALHAAMASVS